MHPEELKIEVTDELGFFVRSLRTWAIIIVVFMLTLFIRHTSLMLLLFILASVFILSLFFDITHERFFIKSIEIKKGHIAIEYFDRSTKKKIEGELSEFNFKETYALNGTWPVMKDCLKIEYKDVTIKQYDQSGWDFVKRKRIIDFMNLTATKKA